MQDIEPIAKDMATYTDMLVSSGLLHLKGGNCSARLGDDLIIEFEGLVWRETIAGLTSALEKGGDGPVELAEG